MKVTGNNAKYTYKVSEKGDELLPRQPELAAFDRCLDSSKHNTIGINFTKVNGRWFLPAPDAKGQAEISKVHQGIEEYFKQARAAILQSKDAATLTDALVEPNKAVGAALDMKEDRY